MADNPFQLVYKELWLMAERNTAITDLIPEGNRIKFENELGGKEDISSADVPELMLSETGGDSQLKASSSHSMVTIEYVWMLSTGTKNINRLFHVLSFELFRAMVDWDRFLCALQWNGEGFVREANLRTASTGELLRPHTRRIQGWASSVSLRVMMMIATEFLRIPDP